MHVDAPAPRELSPAELRAVTGALALPPNAVIVVAVGDIARCDDLAPAAATAALAAAVIEAADRAAVITMGDHAYERGTREELEHCYGPTWGRFNAITFPSPGNHDAETDDALPYYDYFVRYARDPAARERGYYRFELGGWQLFSLNSLLPFEPGSAQIRWLEAELERTASRCTLAYWHHPLVSSGWHGLWFFDRGRDTRAAWDVLLAHGAELVVNGHDHLYERFAPQDAMLAPRPDGIRQLIVGTGGGELTSPRRRHASSERVVAGTFGILVLALQPDRYDWAFVGTDGAVHDRSRESIRCH